ncbi:MAG: type II toxin-antitoxin system RatA family toxin [Gammaproteobacteria bacterium]|nr:type II toxin-antitoxin system RatA family toxin [Gammaproteobacteria bacterium]
MIQVKRQSVVSYTPKQMYDLVNDVNQYKAFVPYCSESKVLSKTANQVVAALTFSLGPVRQTFKTQNTLTPCSRIELNLMSGPFQSLRGYWSFKPVGSGTLIEMDIEFEIAASATAWMIKPILHSTIEQLVDTFTKRAQIVYG